MTITIAFAENSQTVSTTELSIPANTTYASGSPQTADGVFQPWIDLAALAAGDTFRFRIYETVRTSGGTQRKVTEAEFTGVQADPIWTGPSLVLGVGWDMTLIKIAGTDRAIPARIAQIADS